MALSDFDSPDAWRLDLDNRWPERASLKRLVSDTLVQHCEASELRGTVRFLELGPGDGELLLLLQQRCPKADFAAADIQPTLLEFVAARAERPVTCVTADLSQAWSTLPGRARLFRHVAVPPVGRPAPGLGAAGPAAPKDRQKKLFQNFERNSLQFQRQTFSGKSAR